MHNIRLVASDLDGTLLNEEGTLSPYTRETLVKLAKRHIIFIPCTGRDYTDVPEILKKDKNIHYIISGNGSKITDTKTNTILHEYSLSKEDVLKIFEVAGESIISITLSIDGKMYIMHQLLDLLEGVYDDFREILLKKRIIVDDLHPLVDSAQNGIQKVQFNFADFTTRSEIYSKLEELDLFSVTSSHFSNIEVTHKQATKGNALNTIATELNIPYEQRIAFGDNDNDISMMKAVKFGVAMDNATETLKKNASHFAKTNHEDGVADLLQEYILKKNIDYTIRPIIKEEIPLLENFLYEAIFQRDLLNPVSKSIINQPEIKIFIEDFGKEDDLCLVAETKGKIIGAVWTRILSGTVKGFGNIDDKTPEFAISLYKEYRGYGIGTQLMIAMLSLLKEKGYHQASLAVQKDNYATSMYRNIGFKIIDENEEEYIMLIDLNEKR